MVLVVLISRHLSMSNAVVTRYSSMHMGMVDVLFVQDPKHTSGCWSILALPVQEPKSLFTHKLLANVTLINL